VIPEHPACPGRRAGPLRTLQRQLPRGVATAWPALVFLLLSGLFPHLPGSEVELRAPLTTMVAFAAKPLLGAARVEAEIEVPPGAPRDLGVGIFVADRQGHWFQTCRSEPLAAGRQSVTFIIGPQQQLLSEPLGGVWSAPAAPLVDRAGLFFWSSVSSHAHLTISSFAISPLPTAPAGTTADASAGSASPEDGCSLDDLELPDLDREGRSHGHTGERWQMMVLPRPCPVNPYDPREFSLDAEITTPDGRRQRVAGFYRQAMTLRDRGDREDAEALGAGSFCLRYRPSLPGRYQLRLTASWHGSVQRRRVVALPDLVVSGAPWDGYARIDPSDTRFWSVDHAFFWPISINLHSTYDQRSHDRLGTVLTPNRGSLTYQALLQRCAAAGITAVEIWQSSWNLGLEWRKEWPDFEGMGRYNQANAERLDAILDEAWRLGVRVNLVIANHGQASPAVDSEWRDNPYNRLAGGPLANPYELFTSPEALRGQADLRRYLIARYSDHPAILGWKLWSEINLTAAGRGGGRRSPGTDPAITPEMRHRTLVQWHQDAAAQWRQLDIYGHGVTTHWASDYRQADSDIMSLPDISYVCIDAYLQRRGGNRAMTLPELLFSSINDMVHGLGRIPKPILVTEYGGSPQAGSPEALSAEMACAPWAAMVSGLGGSPMLWWSEWVDQGARWGSFAPVTRFLAHEDLRGGQAHAYVLACASTAGSLWGAAWERPGRTLGYLVDAAWAGSGADSPLHDHAEVQIGWQVPQGTCALQWWDADTGAVIQNEVFSHAGGALTLHPPAFRHHLAFKLWRISAQDPPWWSVTDLVAAP
jgi:hypothetical protein